MVSSSRPLNRSSSGRFTRRPGPKNIATDEPNESRPSSQTAAAPASQHAPSVPSGTSSIAPAEKTPTASPEAQRLKLLGANPALKNRGSTRKKGATPISNAEEPRPPTKVTVTQPHGGLVQTTNGVQTSLDIREDDVPSNSATPKPEGTGALLVPGSGPPQSQDKRTLRSQDGGSRLKSDLAIYFPNYDEVISGVPQQPDFLEVDAPIYITDEPLKEAPTIPVPAAPAPPAQKRRASVLTSSQSSANGPSAYVNGYRPVAQVNSGTQTVDFSTIVRHTPHHITSDPLGDDVFFKAHRRAERKEKQLRNIEKERAMHEKVQLERLLDGLLGHDWLRVMGITGITDSERKEWEPKRDYFIAEVRALVDKFRVWKEEEKRLKMEKEQALLAKEEEEDEAEPVEEKSTGEPADSSDVDVWAARQLQQEAISASGSSKSKPRPPPPPIIYRPPSPERPFTSFYSKPHMRAAALGKQRHGRNLLAFGQPIPEFVEEEFGLPEEYLAPDALRAHARNKRRRMREKKQ
ncbi:uncharacterized protein K452DRAFT_355139 [Aplosporella prunicola CBS 121167]|uniref:Something about silencing protein 4 domain-containing protein n=1 Tax=Aplosporella prunicola CBS 121167 TaxID=1176127 RepID=A0A6A6BRF2_9PEZI|nr:uncharacterized protein K452DRAFT_355139 [Aplosporella prunicola CBS 121167]KAF2146666.1 hypothetical protein K452DRAFT_355139 [Aplosporella prunicola CBS 121167]